MNAKPIQIFIAAAPELENELYSIHDLIQQVNKHFRARGYELQAVDGDSADFVQDLHESDLCLALYCNQFGSFTQEYLEDAYKELCENRNPKKIYIYFKNTDAITEELRIFRDSFSEKYGHFYCHFENVDTMRLNFLLQCENYMTKAGQESLLKVRESKIEIAGEEIANLENIPFARDNKNFQDLLMRIDEALAAVIKDPKNRDLRQKLFDLEEERDKREDEMLKLARFITEQSTEQATKRFEEAKHYFEIGDTEQAYKILDNELIARDVARFRKQIDTDKQNLTDHQKALESSIKEWELKIKIISTDKKDGWLDEVLSLYEQAVEAARGYLDDEAFATLLSSYASTLNYNAQYHIAEGVYNELIELYQQITLHSTNNYDMQLRELNNQLSWLYMAKVDLDHAEESIQQAIQIDTNYESSLDNQWIVARSADYGLLGTIRFHNREFDSSITYLEKALEILEAFDEQDANTYKPIHLMNLSSAYLGIGEIEKAEEALLQAIAITKELVKTNDAYKAQLAVLSLNLSVLYSNIGDERASETLLPAIDIYRKLVQNNPKAHEAMLMQALQNMAAIHLQKQEYVQAANYLEEAYDILERLEKDNPQTYQGAKLLMCMNWLKICMETEQNELGEQIIQEALPIARECYQREPEGYTVHVMGLFNNAAMFYLLTDSYAQCKEMALEALPLLEILVEDNPLYYEHMAKIQIALAYGYAAEDNVELAKQHAEYGLTIIKELFDNNEYFQPFIELGNALLEDDSNAESAD